jgi:hypothetical protein
MTRHGQHVWSCGLFFCLGFLLTTLPAWADACRWAEGTGKVAADVLSTAEARQLVLRQARAAAIAEAVGVEVYSETLTRDFMLSGDFVRTLLKGYVQQEKVIQWTQEKYQPDPKESPIPILRVTLRACIVPVSEKKDPGFRLNTTVNKSVFMPGEKARLEIRSTRPAHVTIFNLTEDDHVRLYGEPALGLPLMVDARTPATFPPPGVALTMELPAGQTRASEAFILVGTKAEDRIHLPLIGNPDGILSLADFYGGLSSVQTHVVEEIVPYTIVSR